MKMRSMTPGLLRINCLFVSFVFVLAQAAAFAQNYQGPVYQQPNTLQTTSKYQVLADKVAQISANDQRQDIRLYQIERDVDKVTAAKPTPSTETRMSPPPALIPYVPYQVRKGDSLWRIAMNHRVSPGDIMGFNRMPNETVVEGQVLMIPQKGGSKASVTSAPVFFHTVQPGESFGSIGKKYRVTSDAIAKANPKVNPAKLMAGARLAIPAGATLPQPKAPATMAYDHGLPASKPNKATLTHIVQPGESLSVIAQKYKMTTASLQKANGITDPNSLRVGQSLTVAGTTGVTTKVAANKKAKTSPTPASTPPAAGAGLAVAPNYPVPPTKPTPPPPPAPQPNNRGVVAYRMDKGDTIDSVAQMFGTTGAEVRRLNRLTTSSVLREGDEILVPGMGPVAGN